MDPLSTCPRVNAVLDEFCFAKRAPLIESELHAAAMPVELAEPSIESIVSNLTSTAVPGIDSAARRTVDQLATERGGADCTDDNLKRPNGITSG